MHHHTPIVGPMPMRRPSRTRHNVTDPNPLWFPALVTDPTASRFHFEDLAILVGMPIGACTRQEGDVVAHDAVYGAGHFVHVDVAGEGVCGFGGAGAAAGLGGVADDGARHCFFFFFGIGRGEGRALGLIESIMWFTRQ